MKMPPLWKNTRFFAAEWGWPARPANSVLVARLVQEISFRAWRSWNDCQSVTISVFRGWLAAIGESCLADVRDHITAQCRRAACEEPLDERAIDRGDQRPKAACADEIALVIEAEAFERRMAAQSDHDGLILVWHERDGVSADEIARRIGCSARTVQRTCRAMRAMLVAAGHRFMS